MVAAQSYMGGSPEARLDYTILASACRLPLPLPPDYYATAEPPYASMLSLRGSGIMLLVPFAPELLISASPAPRGVSARAAVNADWSKDSYKWPRR